MSIQDSLCSQKYPETSGTTLQNLAYRKMGSSSRLPRSPLAQTVVPEMRHQRHPHKWHRSEDSAPSDDDNDADYVDETERDDASDSSHLFKRADSNATERVLKQESRESSSPPTEAIPVEGVLNLQMSGSKVRFHSLQLYQDLPTVITDSANLQQGPSPKRPRYLPDEDKFLVDWRDRKLKWADIGSLYKERFQDRPISVLQARYYKLKRLERKMRL